MIDQAGTPTTSRARAILHHPDQASAWSVVAVASLHHPADPADVRRRLAVVTDAVPSVGARLVDDTWVVGEAPQVVVIEGEPLGHPLLTQHYRLDREPPLRILMGGDGRRLAVAAHHAALDGLGLVAVLGALLGSPLRHGGGAPPRTGTPGRLNGRELIGRIVRPADRVAPSRPGPSGECFASQEVAAVGPHFTARLAEAVVHAVGERNRTLNRPWERVAISVGVGGTDGIGNLASYRRVDVRPDADVATAVTCAIDDSSEPPELSWAPKPTRWLAPVASRLSDSFLISNVGRHDLQRVVQLQFFPVARGRSALAIGAAGVARGRATVTLRALHLSQRDGVALLDQAVGRL